MSAPRGAAAKRAAEELRETALCDSYGTMVVKPSRSGLTLERKLGERVVVTMPDGRELDVQVVATGKGRAKLHFVAPRDIRVMRAEVVDTGATSVSEV